MSETNFIVMRLEMHHYRAQLDSLLVRTPLSSRYTHVLQSYVFSTCEPT
jgi:hypothetical protein